MSGGQPIQPPEVSFRSDRSDNGPTIQVQLVTESAIERVLLARIANLNAGDDIHISMFTIADRHIVDALSSADDRGVEVRLLLDPSKGAFGQEGNGMPNHQVAHELMKRSQGNTQVRWCNTQGEQCHSKLVILRRGDTTEFLLGSANLTKRNLGNYNLETNVFVSGRSEHQVFRDVEQFFQRQWQNEPGRTYSVPMAEYPDAGFLKAIQYRLQEFTGLTRW